MPDRQVLAQQGCAEAYKDVVHEDVIRIGGAVKAPDYSFRIGGTRKFFVEAKKPSVNIKDEPSAAYQLRRYAWSAKLPLSSLCDFEEFAVHDCRVKPAKNDPASAARIFYCSFREFLGKWDWIASIFSREAVLKGSFDRFAESMKGKRGTTEVDAAFRAEIENWRLELARNLALRNPKLSQRELNFAVQRIIDRIIFLRIGEDRGIEDYGRFLAKGAKQSRVEVSKVTSLKNLKLVEHVAANHFAIPHERLLSEAWSLKSDAEAAVFAKAMEAGQPLGKYIEGRLFYVLR